MVSPIRKNHFKFVAFIRKDKKEALMFLKDNGATNEAIVIAGMKHIEERISVIKNRQEEKKLL